MCRYVYPSTTKNWNLEICAGEFNGNKDTCSGDAGGPLFVLDTINSKSKYVLAGITAYGRNILILI
jgi:secreted trypsin-like serine protease